jgi:hypothetical protein
MPFHQSTFSGSELILLVVDAYTAGYDTRVAEGERCQVLEKVICPSSLTSLDRASVTCILRPEICLSAMIAFQSTKSNA